MPAIHTAAPQFLVENLEEAMTYYSDRLGFVGDFAYDGFHGSVSRDGAAIHLKCASKARGERAFRRDLRSLGVRRLA